MVYGQEFKAWGLGLSRAPQRMQTQVEEIAKEMEAADYQL